RYYVTESKADDETNAHYRGWIEEGHMIECEGDYIDPEQVEDDVRADLETYRIEKVFFDPFGAVDIATRLAKNTDVEAIKVQQSYTNFSAPMREFERLLRAGRIHHDGNPCLTWMMGNVVAQTTADGKMMRPVKENRSAKIDGAVALLMAFMAAYRPEADDEGDWDEYIASLSGKIG